MSTHDTSTPNNIPAILVERDYKGVYERFALTPEEFVKEFPETVEKGSWPILEADSDTIRPMVHIWFSPCTVGDDDWNTFFSDMEWGLPESDIESGNLAYIREDFFKSLKEYMPAPPVVTLDKDDLSVFIRDYAKEIDLSWNDLDIIKNNDDCLQHIYSSVKEYLDDEGFIFDEIDKSTFSHDQKLYGVIDIISSSFKAFQNLPHNDKQVEQSNLTPYRIAITETYVREVEIYAENELAAQEHAEHLCNESIINLDFDDFIERDTVCRGIAKSTDLEYHQVFRDGEYEPIVIKKKPSLEDLIQSAESKVTSPNHSQNITKQAPDR